MKSRNNVGLALTPEEVHLLQRLRQHPEIRDRVQSILAIADSEEGPLKTADQVEELLTEEMRRLGQVTMTQWGGRAEARVSRELQSQDATVLSRKKKR